MLSVSSTSLSSAQIRALNRLQELGQAIATNTTRLSTFKRINSAKDDPAGLVAASLLQRELTAAEKAASNVTRASAIISTADTTAGEIVTKLQAARTLILDTAGGGKTSAEISANQIEVDSIIRSIDSLAATEFSGRRLLDGSQSFRTSGVNTTDIIDVNVQSKETAGDVTINITVDSSATQATNSFTSGTLSSNTTLTVTGPDGTTTVSLNNGDTTTEIAAAFNSATYLTGITATKIDANQVDFATADFGSAAKIEITASQGTFTLTGGTKVTGTNAVATINGKSVTGDGTKFDFADNQVNVSVTLSSSASGALNPFTVTGTGLEFLVGTNVSNTVRIGMPKLNSANLGGFSGKVTSISSGNSSDLIGGNANAALRIIDDAIEEATLSQAVLGSFKKNTLDSSSRVIASQRTNLSSALSSIQDTNIALETALLVNNQLMQQATLQVLSISSSQQQNILSLFQAAARRF